MKTETGRKFAQLLKSVWDDTDWKRLSMGAQWLYEALISQESMNYAGVLPLTERRWANLAADLTVADIEGFLRELIAGNFIVVDFETEEVLVRSFIRNDGLWRQAGMFIIALGWADKVKSLELRHALAAELARLPIEEVKPGRRALKEPLPDAVERTILELSKGGAIGGTTPHGIGGPIGGAMPGTTPGTTPHGTPLDDVTEIEEPQVNGLDDGGFARTGARTPAQGVQAGAHVHLSPFTYQQKKQQPPNPPATSPGTELEPDWDGSSNARQLAVVPDHSTSVVAIRVEANAVVDRYQSALCPAGVNATTRKSMVGVVRSLLADGTPPAHIEGGIKLWHESSMNHPSQIAQFVHQFANQGSRRVGNAARKAAGYLDREADARRILAANTF